MNCAECPRQRRKYKFFVDSYGPKEAVFAVVGEAPGASEMIQKRPFVGPSGKLIRGVLTKCGVDPDQVYYTNIVKCFATGNKTPTAQEVKLCNEVPQELEAHGVQCVFSLGNIATRTLCHTTTGISKTRGIWHEGPTYRIMPTFHPAAILRNNSFFTSFCQDINKAVRETLEGGATSWAATSDVQMQVLTIPQDAVAFFDGLEGLVAYDIETSALDPVNSNKLLCVSFSRSAADATILAGDLFDYPDVVDAWRRALPRVQWLAHNAQFDSAVIQALLGIRIPVDEDTMLMSYAIDERGGIHGLKPLCQRRLGVPDWDADIKRYVTKKTPSYANIPADVLYVYNGYDTAYCYALYQLLRKDLKREGEGVGHVYYSLLLPAAYALARMTAQGVRIDETARRRELELCIAEQERCKLDLQRIVGDPKYNPNSVPQTTKILYEKFDAPGINESQPVTDPGYLQKPIGRGTKNHTTNQVQLDRLARGPYDPQLKQFAQKLTDYRGLAYYARTYLKNFKPEKDGTIHPRFMLHGTVTGRLSASKPNVMNMPRTGTVRELVIPRDGNILIAADYSQAELRTLAALAHSEPMRAIFEAGQDIHENSGRLVYGDRYDLDPKEYRSIAKTVNFGIPYGREAPNISISCGISIGEAERVIATVRKMFAVDDWIQEQYHKALEQQYVETATGRKRRFPLITNSGKGDILRQSVNAPVQGTASDLMLMSLILVDTWIDEFGGHILYPTHDEILIEVPKEHAMQAARKLQETMLLPPEWVFTDFPVPFEVDVSMGMNASKKALKEVSQEALHDGID